MPQGLQLLLLDDLQCTTIRLLVYKERSDGGPAKVDEKLCHFWKALLAW